MTALYRPVLFPENPALRRGLFFACVSLALFLTMTREANIFDEGIIYGGAMRLLAGQLVHRDFYSNYGPGSYTLVAALFALTGPSFLVGRLFGIATAAGIVTMLHAILEPRVRPLIALGIAALAVLWLIIQPPTYLAPVFPCMLLSLAGTAILLRPDGLRRAGSLLSAGALCGVAALFRYDTGFFLLVAFTLASGLVLMQALPGRTGRVAALRAGLLMGVAAGAVFLPFAAWYLTQAPFVAFRHDIIDYAVDYYAKMRGLPFPSLATVLRYPQHLGIYLPLLIIAASLPTLAADWRKLRGAGERGPLSAPAAILLAVLAGILYYKGSVRVSTLHMLVSLIPAFTLAGLTLERWTIGTPLARWAARGGTLVMVGAGLHGLLDPLHLLRINPPSATLYWLAEKVHIAPRADDPVEQCPAWSGLAFASLEPRYAITAWYLARHSAPSDKVLVGLGQTDRIMINPMFLNYAANRLPGTHWSQFDPGLQNRLDIQQQMVAELKTSDVRWVVRDTSFDTVTEPNGSSWHSGVHLLDSYIDSHYRPIGRSEGVSVWLRKDMAAPDASADPEECRLDPA